MAKAVPLNAVRERSPAVDQDAIRVRTALDATHQIAALVSMLGREAEASEDLEMAVKATAIRLISLNNVAMDVLGTFEDSFAGRMAPVTCIRELQLEVYGEVREVPVGA
jgi:hypothetical protein